MINRRFTTNLQAITREMLRHFRNDPAAYGAAHGLGIACQYLVDIANEAARTGQCKILILSWAMGAMPEGTDLIALMRENDIWDDQYADFAREFGLEP